MECCYTLPGKERRYSYRRWNSNNIALPKDTLMIKKAFIYLIYQSSNTFYTDGLIILEADKALEQSEIINII